MKTTFTPLLALVLILSFVSCGGGKKSSSDEAQTTEQSLSQAPRQGAWQDFPFAFAFGKVSENGKHVVTEGVTFGKQLNRIYALENKSLNTVSHFDRRVIAIHPPVDTLSGDAYKVLYAEDKDLNALSVHGGLVAEAGFFDNYTSETLEELNFEIPPRPIDHLTKRAEELRPLIGERHGCRLESISPLCVTEAEGVVFYQATREAGDDGRVLTFIIMDTEAGVVSYTEETARDPYASHEDNGDDLLRSCFPYPSVHTYFKGKDGSKLVILTDENAGLGIYHLYKVDGDTLIPYTPTPWHN